MDKDVRWHNMIQLKDWGHPSAVLVEKYHSLPKGPERTIRVFVTQIIYAAYLRRELAWVMRDPSRMAEIRRHPRDHNEAFGLRRIALFVNCVSPRCGNLDHTHDNAGF